MNRIIVERSRVEGIPVLTLAQEDSEQRPLVFFLHGFAADKRMGLSLGYELAELGFFYVGLDAQLHGERSDGRVEALLAGKGEHVYPVESGLDFFFLAHEIIVQTAEEIDQLITHFEGDGRVDTNRIGLTGFSMGAFATFYVAANDPRIQVAVPMGGVPAFAARWDDVVLEASAYVQWAEALEQAHEETARKSAFIRTIDPFDKMRSFYPKPLMMISGDKDIDAPKKYSVDLYRALKPRYAAFPERLRLNIYDEAGHELTSAMIQDACDWFSQYLLERAAKGAVQI